MTYYLWRQAIGKRGEANRRVVDRNGRPYHVTKGWRGREPRSDVAEAIAAMRADMAKVNARFEELRAEGPSLAKWPSPKDLIAPDENDAPDIAKIRAWEDALDTPYVDMVFDGVSEPTLPRTLDASDAENALDDAIAHLLASPANAERLMESIEQVKRGETTERELLPPLQFDDIDFSLDPLPIASDPIVEAIANWSVDDYLQARSVVKTLGEHALPADELGRLMALRSMVAVYEDDHGILSE